MNNELRELLERLRDAHVSIAGPEFWGAWKELRALLDKPAAQPQGEPVAMVRTHGSECWEEITGESLEMCKAQPEEYEVRTLYTRPAEQPAPVADSTTSYKYKAELYDEVWQKARGMGFGNVTGALMELEKLLQGKKSRQEYICTPPAKTSPIPLQSQLLIPALFIVFA